MKTIFRLILLFLSLPVYGEILVGVAKNKKNEVVYVENHRVQMDPSGLNKLIHVEYKKPDGSVFATMKSDFTANKTVPETIFEDKRFQLKTHVRIVGNLVEFEEFKNEKSVLKKTFPLEKSMVLSQGFDNFIKMHFANLSSQPLNFKFGALGRHDFFSLTGYKISSHEGWEEFGIRASHWLLRIFVHELKVVYDAKSKRLKSFSGISNIMDDSGKAHDVTIDYQWMDQK